MPAAIWRKQRLGELSDEDAGVLVRAFEWDWSGTGETEGAFAVLALTAEVLETAAGASRTHALRAHDAVQLASALTARAADRGLVDFACFDDALTEAARAEGFRTIR